MKKKVKNNKCVHFYQNALIIANYPIQDEQWPSRRWNKEKTEYQDLSGCNCQTN